MRDRYDVEQSFFSDVVKVALGVFIGAMLAAFAYELLLDWRMERAARQVAAELREQDQRRSAAAEKRRQQIQRMQDMQVLAQRQERERKERKDRAWQAYFTPSPACRLDPLTTPCANAHLAARKRFDETYVDR